MLTTFFGEVLTGGASSGLLLRAATVIDAIGWMEREKLGVGAPLWSRSKSLHSNLLNPLAVGTPSF